MTDADNLSPFERRETLQEELRCQDLPAVADSEPIIIFIPKWQVETWVRCALGSQVEEFDRTTDRPAINAEQIKRAAETIYSWSRTNADIGSTCVPSLRAALSDWARIG
jgi:hypothetical protein